jgi:anaerobic ribonucleoside-triphosphate reductase activating protein
MLKYVDTLIGFGEIPDEISLCINISNCPNNCPECHSSYLKQDIGEELTIGKLMDLIRQNRGITCVCLMGGDANPKEINRLALSLRLISWTSIKTAWYSGKTQIPDVIDLQNFDYIKLGPYIEEFGPLTSKTTNQIMFKVEHHGERSYVTDITSKFWK